MLINILYLHIIFEKELGKKTGLNGRQIQRWFRHRRNKDVQGPMKKFCECGYES